MVGRVEEKAIGHGVKELKINQEVSKMQCERKKITEAR
jgi:hypothetical protein